VTIRQARQMHARASVPETSSSWAVRSPIPGPDCSRFRSRTFHLMNSAAGKPEVILNRRPLKGEPAKFEVHVDTTSGKIITYARVHLLENTTRTGRVLLVAGESMSATEMAGEFLMRSDSVSEVRRMLALPPGSPLPDLEMILRVTEQNEIGDGAQLMPAVRSPANPTDVAQAFPAPETAVATDSLEGYLPKPCFVWFGDTLFNVPNVVIRQ